MPSVNRVSGGYADERLAVQQALGDLIYVRLGTRYRRPTYGSNFLPYLRFNSGRDALIRIESDTTNIVNTVAQGWFTVLRITARIADDPSVVNVEIVVRLLETREVIRTIYPINLG